MVSFEKHRNPLLRATEFTPVCSDCGWRNSGQPILAITDMAMEISGEGRIADIESEYLLKAQEHHKCKAGS